jgi:hypothetical protein
MAIGFLHVVTEEGKRAWVRADEIGTFYETKVYPQPKPGRPPADGRPAALEVIALLLRNGQKLHAKHETLETITSKMAQALGTSFTWIKEPSTDTGGRSGIPTEDSEAA